jgi:hypothetical protein
MSFIDQVKAFQTENTKKEVEIVIPDVSETALGYDDLSETEKLGMKKQFIKQYLEEIKKSDSLLIWNQEKHGKKGYIGANTLMEMSFGYVLEKPLYLLNQPEDESTKLEILGMEPIILNNNFTQLFS